MTKLNDEDFGQPIWSGEPFKPEPIGMTEAHKDDAWAFEMFDREGTKYHFYLSRPESFDTQMVTAVAFTQIPGLPVISADVLNIADPAQYGPQPTTQDEAEGWLNAFLAAWKDKADQFNRSPIVMEPHQGS